MGEARGGRDYYAPSLPDGGVCDPNARLVSMYNCANGSGATFGCMSVDGGQVPQVGQIVSPGTYIFGTVPQIPVYYEIITVNPQNPNLIGNCDYPTIPGVFVCGYDCPPGGGGGCAWAGGSPGQYPNWQACDNAVTAGLCSPTHFCTDYNCLEIVHRGANQPLVSHWPWTSTNPGPTIPPVNTGQIHEYQVIAVIKGYTTTPSNPAALPQGLSAIKFPYSDPGGVWDGVFDLSVMSATPGPPGQVIGINQPATTLSYAYEPLHTGINNCLACCGGTNVASYSNGTPNPHFEMSNQPTPDPGYAAWLSGGNYTQSSHSALVYLESIGINSCGECNWQICS